MSVENDSVALAVDLPGYLLGDFDGLSYESSLPSSWVTDCRDTVQRMPQYSGKLIPDDAWARTRAHRLVERTAYHLATASSLFNV